MQGYRQPCGYIGAQHYVLALGEIHHIDGISNNNKSQGYEGINCSHR